MTHFLSLKIYNEFTCFINMDTRRISDLVQKLKLDISISTSNILTVWLIQLENEINKKDEE